MRPPPVSKLEQESELEANADRAECDGASTDLELEPGSMEEFKAATVVGGTMIMASASEGGGSPGSPGRQYDMQLPAHFPGRRA